MGASDFFDTAEGKTPEEAFWRAVEQAQYMEGHGGYTGTIAEKGEFVMIDVPAEWKGNEWRYAERLVNDDDERISDKWGPAGCLLLSEIDDKNVYLFFGYASE